MTTVRCRDCRHCISDPMMLDAYQFARCAIAPKVDPVTGDKGIYYCSTERTSMMEDACGPQGKHFVPVTSEAAA